MLERDNGDSRYPLGAGGFNFWTHSSGYMSANEGLHSVFLRASEGKEPNVAFFAGTKTSGNDFDVLSILPHPAA